MRARLVRKTFRRKPLLLYRTHPTNLPVRYQVCGSAARCVARQIEFLARSGGLRGSCVNEHRQPCSPRARFSFAGPGPRAPSPPCRVNGACEPDPFGCCRFVRTPPLSPTPLPEQFVTTFSGTVEVQKVELSRRKPVRPLFFSLLFERREYTPASVFHAYVTSTRWLASQNHQWGLPVSKLVLRGRFKILICRSA